MTVDGPGCDSPYSPDYATARARFLALSGSRGFRVESFPTGLTGPSGEDLAVDVALLGPERPERVLVVSSGLHGVEGFFGSAVQLSILARGTDAPARPLGRGDALVLVHALNPYGFAWCRRFDEANVDPNRNMLVDGEPYRGSPPGYAALNGLLNPVGPPSPVDLFPVRSLLAILRHGMHELKATIAGGQYDYPRGLFFGGHGPSRTQRVLAENLPRWVGEARSVLHLDWHTGLGQWGTYRLLLEPGVSPARAEWVRRTFGADVVDLSDPAGISYPTRGDLGAWCRQKFPGCSYDYVCGEFGTYPALRVISALRSENQAHHWLAPGDPRYERAKRRLKNVFAPDDPAWRATAVSRALALFDRARDAVFGP